MKDKYRIIYKPRGAALEYSPLAANLYSGCPHGCSYCYAPSCLRRSREDFHSHYTERKDVVNQIQKDLVEMQELKDGREVMLCFTCDPYPGECEDNRATQRVLELFKAYNQPFQILTKAGMKAARDFHLYKKTDHYAVTLTCDNDTDSLKWEPGASTPGDRVASLKKAKEKGINTWVSFEPVLYPDQVYRLFEKTKDFVDLFKIGKLNHMANDTNWKLFGHTIINLCEKNGKEYMIKDALKSYI